MQLCRWITQTKEEAGGGENVLAVLDFPPAFPRWILYQAAGTASPLKQDTDTHTKKEIYWAQAIQKFAWDIYF